MPLDPDHRSRPRVGGRHLDTTVTCRIAARRSPRGARLIIGLALGVPSFLLITLSTPLDSDFTNWATYLFTLALYLFIVRLMLLQIFNAPVITINTIGLALCTYIILGAIWVMFYTVVVAFDPVSLERGRRVAAEPCSLRGTK